MISPCPVAKLNLMVTHLLKKRKKLSIKFSEWHWFVQTWWHTHFLIIHYSCNTYTLRIPSKSELQTSLLKFECTTYSAIYSIAKIVLKILQWLNFDWINKSRFSLNLESCKLWVEFKGKILQVNQFTPVGNTMDLFWLMHEVLLICWNCQNSSVFDFLFLVLYFTAKLNEFA